MLGLLYILFTLLCKLKTTINILCIYLLLIWANIIKAISYAKQITLLMADKIHFINEKFVIILVIFSSDKGFA